jgi:L-ascorbate metabolism protein UlaG (beta-lactamase superfamily)
MKLTRIDLNSWIFSIADKTILVDPWLVDPLDFYGLPWLFRAYHNTPLAFTPATLPAIDLLLISQGVDDHCHKPTLEQLDRSLPVVASPTAAKVVRSLGYKDVTELSHWQSVKWGGNLEITAALGAEIQPGQVENGFLLRDLDRGETLYYEPHLSPLAELGAVGQVDVAIAPVVGQIFPLLGQVIMGPLQAMQLVGEVKPRYFVPTAMGDIRTSGLLPMMIRSVGSVEEFGDRLLASGLPTELLLPEPGQTLVLEKS